MAAMAMAYTLNAFSGSLAGGNPAGVVPEASLLNEAQMQTIAKQLGHSETAFVQPSDSADFKVRFFTPVSEVDLCGHATIATFFLLFKLGTVSPGNYTQETGAGILNIEISDLGEVFMTQTRPVFADYVDKSLIADSLNIGVNSMHSMLLPQIVSTGLRDIIVPVRDLETLNAIKPDLNKVSSISKKLDVIGYHLFSLETMFGNAAHCRNLAPLFDIPEEAATGTANGALSCYLFAHDVIDACQAGGLVFEQGYSLHRPSEIKARLKILKGIISRVEVGGIACLVDGPSTMVTCPCA
jgi:PhzF family phenazine biosynthesis protein